LEKKVENFWERSRGNWLNAEEKYEGDSAGARQGEKVGKSKVWGKRKKNGRVGKRVTKNQETSDEKTLINEKEFPGRSPPRTKYNNLIRKIQEGTLAVHERRYGRRKNFQKGKTYSKKVHLPLPTDPKWE